MNAATPPFFWASAMTCWQTVVLPLDSGPKISVIRPRGTPPTPKARSNATEPVGMTSTARAPRSPRRMIAPRPNCFSIWRMAASTARLRSPFFSGVVWGWAGAAGASIGLVGSFCFIARRRTWSLLLAGFEARLALWLDHFDRCRRLVGRYGRRLGRFGLWLSLLLVAWSVSALRHVQQTSASGRSRFR